MSRGCAPAIAARPRQGASRRRRFIVAKAPLTFRIFHGGKLVRQETLALGVIKLGKVPSAHLRIEDESVSRMHAILEVEPSGELQLIDLGSTRGTYVNGTRINKAKVVSGDELTLGDTRIELTVGEVAEAPAAVAMPAAPAPAPAPTLVPPPPPRAAAPALRHTDAGAGAVEVAAMLGDSVVEVKHCMDPRGGKVTRGTYALLGASLVCVASAAGAFVAGVHVASRNAAALDYWTHVAHKPAHAFRPEQASTGLDALELGGLAFGLAAAAAGLARARRERRSPYFRIGTAPGVELATDAAPAASFPLVAPSGDDFVFHFAAGMDGELIVAGAATPFAELVASGRARPSATVAGALELPIPAAARIRARAGATTFLVSAVDRPRAQPLAGFALDSRAALYAAASLVAHIGLYGLAQLGTADAASIGVDVHDGEDVGIRATITDHEDTPPIPDVAIGNDGGQAKTGGGQMALPEGAAGKPTADKVDGQMQIKDHHLDTPQIARQDAIEYARTAGVLGDTMALQSSISALGGTASFSNGLDTDDVYGPLFGAAGEGRGNFGMGRTGWSGGGGCGGDCGGIGVGNYHTIGTSPGKDVGWGRAPAPATVLACPATPS